MLKYGDTYSVNRLGDSASVEGTLEGIEMAHPEAGPIGLWLRQIGNADAQPFYVGLGPGIVVRRTGQDATYVNPFDRSNF